MRTHPHSMHAGKSAILILEISGVAGSRKVKPEDLVNVQRHQLPPETLMSLGSKKYVDPKALSFVNRLRNAADGVCSKVGIRFARGAMIFIVPVERLDALSLELEELRREYYDHVASLAQSIDDLVDAWVKSQPPEYAEVIRKACVRRDYITERMHFDVMTFQAGSLGQANYATAEQGGAYILGAFDQRVTGLGKRLLVEVADRANGLIAGSYHEGRQPTKRILGAIEEIAEKIEGLSYLEPGFDILSNKIMSVAQMLRNRKGAMDANGAADVLSLLMTLSNPATTMTLVGQLQDGDLFGGDGSGDFATPYLATPPMDLNARPDDIIPPPPLAYTETDDGLAHVNH